MDINTRCWRCGAVHDRARNLTGKSKPRPGDITLCIKCGEWSTFVDRRGAVRQPTNAEFIEIGESAECRKLREAWIRAFLKEQRQA